MSLQTWNRFFFCLPVSLLLFSRSFAQSLCFYDAILGGPLQWSGGNSGTGIYGITSGDFNEDGVIDIATANGASGNISVLFGNLNGIFDPPVNYPGDQVMADILAVDINNDSILDLVATDQASVNPVMSYIGYGNGTFFLADSFVAGGFAESLTSADFNGDGYADFATADWGTNTVSVLINDGTGSFLPTVAYATGETWIISNGDFNGDSIPDLAVTADFNQRVTILDGNGDGTFSSPHHINTNYGPLGITTYDLNEDGFDDIICSNYLDANLSIHYSNGDGTFQPEQDIFPEFYDPTYAAVKDLNNDGFPDLVFTAYGPNGFAFMLNDGNNNFLPPGYYISAVNPIDLEVIDVNNDGYLDVISPSSYDPLFSCHINCTFTGIEEQSESYFIISPNPVTDHLMIQGLPDQPVTLLITDLLGREMKREENTSSMDVSSLPDGTYLLTIKGTNWQQVDKVVVQ